MSELIKTKRFDLSESIKAHGETVDHLDLREPTARDIRECGFIFESSKNAKFGFDAAVIAEYIERLAGIPSSSVDQLCAYDFMQLGLLIASFFKPRSQTTL